MAVQSIRKGSCSQPCSSGHVCFSCCLHVPLWYQCWQILACGLRPDGCTGCAGSNACLSVNCPSWLTFWRTDSRYPKSMSQDAVDVQLTEAGGPLESDIVPGSLCVCDM